MADNSVGAMLLDLGFDISPIKTAARVVTATMEDLNRITSGVEKNARNAALQQKPALDAIKVSSNDIVKAALEALAGQQKISQVTAKQTEALNLQVAALKLQSVELTKHMEMQDKITAKLREQLAEQRKAEHEKREGGFGSSLTSAILGGGAAGKLGSDLVTGVGIGAIFEYATESIVKFVEKLKEGTVEASKLSQAMDLFNKTATGHNLDPVHFMAQLQVATEGLVSKLDLAVLGARALNSGLKDLTPEKILELTHATIALAEVNKSTAKEAVAAITQMFTRGADRSSALLATVTGIPAMTLRVAEFGTELNRAGRQAASLDRILALLIAQEAKLGETPDTLEKALERLKIVFSDLFTSFGQGVNESGGMQSFFALLKDGAASLTKMEDSARKFGHVFGDALGTVGIVAGALLDTLIGLGGTAKGLAELGGSLLGINTGVDKIKDNSNEATDSFTAWRTSLLDIVKTFLTLNSEVQILAVYIKRVLEDMAGMVSKYQSYKDFMSNPLGAIFGDPRTLFGMPHHGTYYRGKPTDAKGGVNGQSGDPEIAAIQARLNKLLNDVDQIGKTPGTPTTGSYSVPGPTDENRVEQTRLAAAQLAYEDARQARIKANAEAENKIKLSAIEDAKEVETAAYRAAEVTLEDHLKRMRELQAESYLLEQDDAKANLISQIAEGEAKRKEILAKAKADQVSPKSPEIQLQFKALDEKQLAAEENYARQLAQLKITNNKINAGYDAQYAADYLASLKTGIAERLQVASTGAKDELALLEQRNRTAQELNQKLLGTGDLSPDTYQARQLALIGQLRDAQIAAAEAVEKAKREAAEQTFKLEPNKLQATAVRDKAITAAQAEAAKAIASAVEEAAGKTGVVTQELPAEHLAAIQRVYKPQQQSLISQLQLNQEHPELATQSSETILRNLIASYEAEQRSLSTVKATGILEEQRLETMQQMVAALIKYNVELRQTLDLSIPIGAAFGAVGQGISSTFRSKFAQNLAQSVQAGSKGLSDSTRLGLIFQRPVGKSGHTFTTDAMGNPQEKATSTVQDKVQAFADKLGASISAITNFTDAILNAHSAVAGAAGGAVAGAGAGNTLSSIVKGFGGNLGPWGELGGAVLGAGIGAITGDKQAKVTANINQLNTTFKNTMNAFANNTNNLQDTITQLEGLMARAEQLQAGSKKGGAAYQQAIDQYISQITQLQTQQQQTVRQMNQQLAILQEPVGAQGYLQDLQSILKQYEQFAGAAKTTEDLANANQFLTESLQQYEQSLATTLLQDNTQAIQDALTLNDLLFQRQQLTLQYNQQVTSILGQGVLQRTPTRAMTTGQQVQQLNLTYQRQKQQLDEQVAATSFKVQSEAHIFDLAQTRIGLENQLLAAQNAQTTLDMQRITALQKTVELIGSGNFGIGALGALLATIQTATTAGGNQSILDTLNSLFNSGTGTPTTTNLGADLLELLASLAYQNRAQLGFGGFNGQNL